MSAPGVARPGRDLWASRRAGGPGASRLIPVRGWEVTAGTDLAAMICDGAVRLVHHDVVVVTQKVVSKAEGAMERADPDDPLSHKPLVEREVGEDLRRRGDLIISETRHGFVCANAGIDLSNVERGWAACCPRIPDRRPDGIRDGIRGRTGTEVGGSCRTRSAHLAAGATDVAIGSAGLIPVRPGGDRRPTVVSRR